MDSLDLLRSMLGSPGPGLEIGPLHRAVAPKRDGYQVEILDHASAEELRQKYRDDPTVPVDRIEQVDYVSDGRPMVEVIGGGGRYEWVIASHVIEHTPDMIGFLRDCAALLRPGGRLVLAIPDRRFCFDALRPVSSLGPILQAHREARTRHAEASLFDCVSEFCRRDDAAAWGEGHPGMLRRVGSTADALRTVDEASRSAAYTDTHAWVFTPNSFRLIIETLHEAGLVPLREADHRPTIGCEFFMVLSPDGAGPGLSMDDLRRAAEEDQLAALLERFGVLPGRVTGCSDAPGAVGPVVRNLRAVFQHGREMERLAAERMDAILEIRAERNRAVSELDQARQGAQAARDAALAELAATRDALRGVEAELDRLRNSRSWRTTRPVRWAACQLRRWGV